MRQIIILLILAITHVTTFAQNPGQKVYSPDANSGDYFGKSVSLFGQYSFIGSPSANNDSNNNETGAVYIFNKVGDSWNFLEKIFEPDIYNMSDYGFAVDNSQDYAIIGAPQFGSSGAAYVYKRNGINWERQLKLPEYYRTKFGYSVAIDSNYIVVGAPDSQGWGPSWSSRGAAWVFTKTGTVDTETWTEVSKIAASDGYDNGHFGYDVDISGNHIIVGAWTASANYFGRSASYIYGYENGVWVEKQRLFPSGTDTTTNHFGKCVSIFNDIAAVGAPEELNENVVNGAVYIFEKNNDGWNETAKIISPDTRNYISFGRSIDINNSRIIIGALNAVYIYEKNEESSWQLLDSVHYDYDNNGYVYYSFGESVSLADSTFLVGAYDDCDMATLAGASHFYKINSTPTSYEDIINTFNTIQIYPNPVNSTLNIDNIQNERRVFVFNSIGLKLKEIDLSQTNRIDFSRYIEGIYFLTFINERNEINTIKVIKN